MLTVGQNFIIGISGKYLTNDEKKFIVENNIGGIVLFTRNVESPEQLHQLCTEIQSLRHQMINKVPLFIGIDMEGGRVLRLKEPFTPWPAIRKLGDIDSPTTTFEFAHKMGTELRAVGINLDFAPCVDVQTNPENKVIGDRSFGTTADIVEKHTSAIIRGYLKSEIITCAKHFPGHGHTLIDSHEDLPISEMTMDELENVHLIPFKKAIRSKVNMIMTSHIRFSKIDPEWPATLSEIHIQKLLKDNLKYDGLIITDDLDMKAMTNFYPKSEIPIRALIAGADILLYCNEPLSHEIGLESVKKAVQDGRLDESIIAQRSERVIDFKRNHILHPDPKPFTEVKDLIGCKEHKDFAAQIKAGEIPN